MIHPLLIMMIGIVLVITLIMAFRVNAFLALIAAAMVVSLLAFDPVLDPAGQPVQPEQFAMAKTAVSRVAEAFGTACGKIGIVIALAAIIGDAMMASGAADRIVRAFMNLLGEKRAPIALSGSGFLLGIPVFFDTVFYLLVPLARSFYKRTGRAYLLCILAITAGGAATHTLVPPTPGPLTVAATLNVDLGRMIMVGILVGLPATTAGLLLAAFLDRKLNIPMREVAGQEELSPLPDDKLPNLMLSLTPVVLPVLMIACHTLAESLANLKSPGWEETAQRARSAMSYTAVFGNPNFALSISTVIAVFTWIAQRTPTKSDVAKMIETSLMSAGLIILITAAGSAFGDMLKVARVGTAIEELFKTLFGESSVTGHVYLLMGFVLAAVLKIAQGSSTAAMIITSGMMAAMLKGVPLPFDMVYVATSIAGGSLIGSWMNDSGFWIFARMGGLTEREALATWTPLLIVLGTVTLLMTLLLATVMPLV